MLVIFLVRNGSDPVDHFGLAHAGAQRQAAAQKLTFAASALDRGGNSRVGWRADIAAIVRRR